jgi:D-alanyl-D-alanine carboxypeptidase
MGCLFVGGGSVLAVMVAPQLLMGMAPSEPFEIRGFRERPDADGRLLGHFPYREALIEELIVFQPGVELHVDTAAALNSMMNAAISDGC